MENELEKIYDKILDKIPKEIDFGFIAVKNESFLIITVENINKFTIPFSIDSTDIFKFEPNQGNLPKLGKTEIRVKINPQSAIVSIGNAQIVLGKETNRKAKIIKLNAISKYPYLKIHKNILDYGNVIIGKTKELELIINNPEKVPAKFNVDKKKFVKSKLIEQFYVSDLSGVVPPNSSFLLKVKYVTSYPNFFSYETFDIITKGGNINRFNCIAHSLSLNTNISEKFVNFYSVELNSTKTKMIRLFNESEEATFFQFYYNNDHVFIFDQLQGIIPAKSNVRVTITFNPKETISYYDRIFCLIQNHFLFAIDLCGSCHDLLIKPKLISQKHVDIFRYKSANGAYIPHKLGSLGGSKEFDISYLNTMMTKSLKKSLVNSKPPNEADEGLIDFSNQIQLHKEILWENTSDKRLFSSNSETIDFRFVESGRLSEPYIVTITNNSTEKLKVKWLLDKPVNTNSLTKAYNLFSQDNIIFIVTPEEAILPRKSNMDFKVFFKPNKPEYYFFCNLTCLGSLQTNYDHLNIDTSKSFDLTKNNLNTQRTISSLGYKTNLLKSINKGEKTFEYFDPPYPLKISVVGHSFPPSTQIFMPMMELIPQKEIIFPPCSILQSCYQTLMIKNNSDTPLYYKFMHDTSNVFRIHPKDGLVQAKNFNMILIEFCPYEIKSYIYPLKIIFNHDSMNMHTILLNGICSDPNIEVEGINEEIFFPPSFVGISTSKSINIVNKSPIKVNVQLSAINAGNGIVNIEPNYFEMEANQMRKVEVYLCPLKIGEVESKIEITVGRIYDSNSEMYGIYNPGFITDRNRIKADKRMYKKNIRVIGKGNDGDIIIDPPSLDFGTVKVGFHKKLSFSIFNPTLCNFYIKMFLEEDDKGFESVIDLDFREGILNSLCKKDVNITFLPNNRSNIEFNISLFAMENKTDKITQNMISSANFETQKTLKAQIRIKANGDYPLLKVTDIRNSIIGVSKLWQSFNINDANDELCKKLTEEELMFVNNERSNNKLQDYYEKLKCIKFDFGKHLVAKRSKDTVNKPNYIDVYLTLKNVGGVTSEFFFKFPDDISIKRETWMDVVEAESNETKEYHVLKNNIFDIYPRKNKLEPKEVCNIRFRYDVKQIGEHRLRVIFQIVNGKPLIFDLYGESHSEKKGILEIRNQTLDFLYVPMGYMMPIVSPLEIRNVGGIKIRYKINENEIKKYNTKNDDFPIFRLENTEGSLGPGEVTYVIGSFRPLTHKEYRVVVPIEYSDGSNNNVIEDKIILSGFGFNPMSMSLPKLKSIFYEMPKSRQFNYFDNNIIQKCGVSLEEIDFDSMEDGKSASQTFILYNYSESDTINFEFFNPGFNMKDELIIEPIKGRLGPNSHLIVKIKLIPKNCLSNFEGEIEIKINWILQGENKISQDKESLFIRVAKKAYLKDLPGKIEQSINPNSSFIEAIMDDFIKEIICDKSFDDLLSERLDEQPNSIYQWTNNQRYVSHEDVRTKIITNYLNITISNMTDINTSSIMTTKRNLMQQQRNISSKESTHSKSKESEENRLRRAHLMELMCKDLDMNYGEGEDLKMEDKYMNEIIGKIGYSTSEVNEKILLVNEESKNLINSILENTFFNIISEAIFGETDLSEPSKIFYLKK